MDPIWFLVALSIMLVGLVGTVIPLLPGLPLVLGGIWVYAIATGLSESERPYQPRSGSSMIKSETAWQQARIPRFPKLSKKASFDAVVVGGGITGLTAAYLLQQAGRKVCLLERDRLGQGDTSCTTAHLTAVTDLRVPKLVSHFGEQNAQLVWNG